MTVFLKRIAVMFAGFFILLFSCGLLAGSQYADQIRTPPAPEQPRIHGPEIYGVRPGHPFLYRVPSTGIRPIRFSAKHLPRTLTLGRNSGIISGHAPEKPGSYVVELRAANAKGKTSRTFRIVVGNEIGLTPQMGWNSWYTFYDHITDQDVRRAADAMISSGMADYGYQYVSIDDCWANRPHSTNPDFDGPVRDAHGVILSNKRFPDMSALTAYIHAKGLKAGIYSSPGPLTCGGFEGSYGHEQQDASQFAHWGFDLLKYDWCSYKKIVPGDTLADYQFPYRKMGGILQGLDRDVVFNLCQYGMKDVWKWGREVGGNSWRTTGDLGVARATQLPGFYSIGFSNAAHSRYAGPGGWNDPDYILIGKVGNAFDMHAPAQETQLTPDEQYSYISMWSLMSAPLFFGGDMTDLDPFTLNVLCNPEVIDIDQDSLGKQARIVRRTDEEFVLEKPLANGSIAVGLFNLGETPRPISIRWTDLNIQAKRERVRDVWRERDLGKFRDGFSRTVAPHGVELFKISTM
jgi:alpha-galactosidase